MKICSNCVIPETAETLIFDKKNKCSVCTQIEFKKKIDWNKREEELDILIKKYKGKYEYDCIIPFSGGKDSTFALWYLVVQKKLKPLVVRFDHNFLRPTIQKNTQKIIKKLGVDFYDFTPDFDIVKKLMLESFIRRGDFCWHCHVGIAALPINISIEKNIPLIFYGEPSSEYSSFYDYSEPEELSEDKFNKLINLGINAEDMLGMLQEKYPKLGLTINDLKPYVFPDQRTLKQTKTKACYLGNYVSWDVRKQVKIIKEELGWEGDVVEGIPREYDYEKIECMMQGSRDYIRYIKRGYGRTAHLASIDIRNKRMSREEGLELTKLYDGKRPKSLNLLIDIMGISEEEFLEIVNRHVISPQKPLTKEKFERSNSNTVPPDIEEWYLKFK